MTDQPTPISRAERRRAARAEAQTEAEAPVEEEDEPATEDAPPQGTSIFDTIRGYGNVIADLQRDRKLPVQHGIKLVETILQYDINRRHLAVQEAEALRGLQGLPEYAPPGAIPRTPEEVEALAAQPPEED